MVFKKIIFQNRYVELETPAPPFMEKTILNFHFDYLHTSLSYNFGYLGPILVQPVRHQNFANTMQPH